MGHPTMSLSYADSIHYVEKWLTEHWVDDEARAKGTKAFIYDYYDGDPYDGSQSLKDRPFVGVRVSEVSFSNSVGGSSYMQVDAPWGIAVCGQVERCILALVEGWNDGVVEGETDEEFWRLNELFKLAHTWEDHHS